MFEEAINNVSAFMHTLSSQNILPPPNFLYSMKRNLYIMSQIPSSTCQQQFLDATH